MQKMCIGSAVVQVKNEQEALYLACEMERRAVRLYERGMLLCQDSPLKQLLAHFCAEEKEHLAKFSMLGKPLESAVAEEQLLLSAYAAQILFPGGLMEAHRAGALDSISSLLQFAMESEEKAVGCYRIFSSSCQDQKAKDMFLAIAQQEQGHLEAIVQQIKSLDK